MKFSISKFHDSGACEGIIVTEFLDIMDKYRGERNDIFYIWILLIPVKDSILDIHSDSKYFSIGKQLYVPGAQCAIFIGNTNFEFGEPQENLKIGERQLPMPANPTQTV